MCGASAPAQADSLHNRVFSADCRAHVVLLGCLDTNKVVPLQNSGRIGVLTETLRLKSCEWAVGGATEAAPWLQSSF